MNESMGKTRERNGQGRTYPSKFCIISASNIFTDPLSFTASAISNIMKAGIINKA